MSNRTWIAMAAVSAGMLIASAGTPAPAADKEQPRRVSLESPTTIGGVPCAAGYAWRFADGALGRCTLAKESVVDGARLPAGSTVALEVDGRISYVFLPGTTVIEGHKCRGHGHDIMTGFHQGGRLKLCWLEDDEVVQGVPCARTSFLSEMFGSEPSGVTFAENGRLTGCRLSRDLTIDGRVFAKGTRAGLDEAGRLHPATWGSK